MVLQQYYMYISTVGVVVVLGKFGWPTWSFEIRLG